MSDWELTVGLQHLRAQVDAAFPNRDKTSDGTIGDAAHQASTSGHNPDDTPGSKPEWDGDDDNKPEVRSWDMDSDLRAGEVTAQQVVDHIRGLPKLDTVLRYMIYNRKIYEASNGWNPRAYTGPSPHTEHIHFSGARTQAADNNTTFDYRLEDLIMPTAEEIAKAVWAYKLNSPWLSVTDRPAGDWLKFADAGRRDLAALSKSVTAALTGLAAKDQVDEQALAAELAPAVAALIIPALPAGVAVTEDQLTAALLGALRQLAAPEQPATA